MLKEEIYDKIKSISLKELEALVVNILSKDYSKYKGDKKEDTLKNIIDGFYDDDKFLDFLDFLTSLKDISVNKAKNYIVEQKIASIDEIKTIRRKSTLLIFLFKNNLLDYIELITFFSEINKTMEEKNYILEMKISEKLNDTIESSLKNFYKEWNNNNLKKIYAFLLPSKGELFIIKIIKEIGYRNQNQFHFRDMESLADALSEIEKYKVKRLVNYPVSYKKMIVNQIDEDKFELTFYFDIKREKFLVESLISHIFSNDFENKDLVNKKSKTTQIIEKSAEKVFVTAGDTPFERSKNNLVEYKNEAIKKIKESTETPENKRKIEEIANNIYILPPRIFNAPEKGIINIEINIKPDDFFSETSGNKITEYLFEIAKDLDISKKSYSLYMNGKIIEIKSGKIEQAVKDLNENEKKAIAFIFGELNE